ncbi:MAG: DUF177 domain-containing protein [Acidimicrobiales bacterium]|nr:DUF177 domain-containing protein [Acidimicrobiales bacterium]
MPRSPLLIGVTELRRRPGTQREVTIDAEVPGLSITTARVPAGEPVQLDLVLEAIDGAITATGRVTAPWSAECRRCLDDVRGVASVDIREVFETHPVAGETYPIDGDDIDLEPVVRDTVLLHLPLAPLCRPDCLGPAPDEFPAVVEGAATDPDEPPDADGPPRDPRWAALDELRLDPD